MGKILSGISGERFPYIDKVPEIYSIIFKENTDIASVNEDEILWQVYWTNEYSEYEKVPFSGQKKGKEITITFKQALLDKNLQLKATYKDETVELHITPQSNGEEKIIDVFFVDAEYKTKDKENLKYINSINLQIYTLNMLGKYVDFKIYDTVNGEEKELYKSEKSLQIIQKNGIVKTKQAVMLTPFLPIKAQKDMSGKEHFYKLKIWQTGNEANFYEEEIKIKNEMGKMDIANDSQVPITTGTSEPKKKEEEENKCERCTKLTKEELKAIFTSASDDTLNKVLEAFNEGMKYFEINTCLRKAHFFAQALKEVGPSFTIKVPESLNYRTDGLINGYWYIAGSDWVKGDINKKKGGYFEKGTKKATINFSYTKKHPEVAEKYGRKDLNKYGDGGVQKANSELLANYLYANRLGNGNPESGDGSKFRGKGLIQLTGRSNYENVNEEMQKFDSSLEDILKNPNKILTDVKLATLSAMGFWKVNKINNVIGKDTSDNVVYLVTNIVNSAEDVSNKLKRYNNFKDITKKTFKVNDCKDK